VSHQPSLRRLGRLLGLLSAVLAAIGLMATPATAGPSAPSGSSKIESTLAGTFGTQDTADFYVEFSERADLRAASQIQDWNARGAAVVAALQQTANTSQATVRKTLDAAGTSYTAFWVANTILVRGGTQDQVNSFAGQGNVTAVRSPKTYSIPQPTVSNSTEDIDTVEWGINAISAPQVWSTYGVRGEGIVVANIDTGVDYTHPALTRQYRGNTGSGFDHNYNWFDPSHICATPAPCDNNNHGSHTMGTMLGETADGVNQIGVAPAAKWMAAKGCESNSCSDSALLASGQWILAPTRLDGTGADPSKRPNIVNNSWGGAGGDTWYRQTVSNWRDAGIFPAFSNGNSGPSCATAGSPGDYDISYASGAFDINGAIASFSSRGAAAGGLIKPNLAAPGVNVRSSVPGGYANFNGTSMASPHTAGTVALMWSAAPALVGDIPATIALLNQTAVDTDNTTCGGTPANNNVWGEGKLNAFAAVTQSPRGPTGTLTVNVTGGGSPLSGVAVNITNGTITRSGTTPASGSLSFLLPVGPYTITTSKFGFANGSGSGTVTDGGTTVVDIAMSQVASGTLRGVVTSVLGGGPVANATVTVTGTPLPSATTDSNGNYSIANVPFGSYTVSVTAGGCFGSLTQSVDVNADPTTANFGLQQRSDSFGYSCVIDGAGYVELQQTLALTGDDATVPVNLPFSFFYYGNSYSTAHVSSNGHINFLAPSTAFGNVSIPSTSTPNAAIYPFWDDLLLDSSSQAFAQVVGSAPNRSYIVEWRNARFFSSAALRIDVEAQLNEDGTIIFRYRNIDTDPLEHGSSATVGIENAAGTVALQFSSNAAVLNNSQSIRFVPPPSGTIAGTVTDANDTGSLAGATVQFKQGSSVVATVTTPASGAYSVRLLLGTYTVTASKTNYVSQTSSVTLGANGQSVTKDFALATARGVLDRDTVFFLGNEGQLRTTQVTLNNTSTSGVALTYTLDDDASWLFTVPGSSGSNPIPAGGSRTLTVRADASGLDAGVHRGTVTITTNSGRVPVLTIAVTLVVPARRQGLNSGGSVYTDTNGDPWGTDQAWTPGGFGYLGGGGLVLTTKKGIAGTDDDALYQDQREQISGYRFDNLPAGTYEVDLDFAELKPDFTGGKRVFNVSINGTAVLSNYDIAAAVGTLTADHRVFTVSVADGGSIQVDFGAIAGKKPPVINAIRITHRPDMS
jgi:subtilisin family serine protease